MGPAIFFFRNSLSDQWSLAKALALVWLIRLGLWLLPFRVLQEIVARRTSKATSSSAQRRPQDLMVVRKVASSVRRVSRYVPEASCLTQALATQVLLASQGQISDLRIGVTKGEEGELAAHAWVESEGKIVMGNRSNLSRYAVLSRISRGRIHERDIRNL